MPSLRNIYLGCRQFLGPNTQDRIAFIHVPKCGGSSVNHAIRRSFGLSEYYLKKNRFELESGSSLRASSIADDDLMAYREKLLLYYLSSHNCKYISGHFDYAHKAFEEFRDVWNFITILREPVSKWFSQYFYNRNKNFGTFQIESTLDEYLESEEGIALGGDYVRKFSGIRSSDIHADSDTIDCAIRNLDNFALVGVLEHLDRFIHDFEDLFDVRLFITKGNVSPIVKSKQKQIVTDLHRQKVKEICQPDTLVYQAALKKIGVLDT
jgi:hypothetical protein